MSEDKPEIPFLTFEELHNEFQTWSSQHGNYEEMKNGMPFYRIRHYPTAMNALVLRFIEIGYSESQIRGGVLSMELQKFCTSYRHPNKENWKKQIKKLWDFAVNDRFPSTKEIMEAEPVEQDRATVVVEPLKPAKKDLDTLDMSKHEGFGQPLRKQTDEDFLAELDEGSDE